MKTKDNDILDHTYDVEVHNTHVFPEDTPDCLVFTAGDANNDWAKAPSGTASEAGSNTLLTDDTTDFIAIGARVGQTISNDTDVSTGTITGVTEHTITCSGGLAGGTDDTWENADEWTITNTNGWVEILDSDDNKLGDLFTDKGHISSIDIDQVEVADKSYILEVGTGVVTDEVTTVKAMIRFISATAGANFQTPKHYRIRTEHFESAKNIYYRMKCETGESTMNGSIRFYLHNGA